MKKISLKDAHNHRFSWGAYQMFMLVLSMYALAAIGYEAITRPGDDVRRLLWWADLGLCAAFLIDFVVSLVKAPNRWKYLYTWGWIDLLSSLPPLQVGSEFVRYSRVGRVLRIVRAVRVLRAFRATRTISRYVLERRAQSTLLAAALLFVLFVFLGSVSVLQIETVPDARIHTSEQALWWAFATVTSVDNNDIYPVTTTGHVIAAILAIVGAGLFGAFVGSVGMWFLAPTEEKDRQNLVELRVEMAELKQMLQTRKEG